MSSAERVEAIKAVLTDLGKPASEKAVDKMVDLFRSTDLQGGQPEIKDYLDYFNTLLPIDVPLGDAATGDVGGDRSTSIGRSIMQIFTRNPEIMGGADTTFLDQIIAVAEVVSKTKDTFVVSALWSGGDQIMTKIPMLIPENWQGERLTVKTPSGEERAVIIPKGAKAGKKVKITVPRPPPAIFTNAARRYMDNVQDKREEQFAETVKMFTKNMKAEVGGSTNPLASASGSAANPSESV